MLTDTSLDQSLTSRLEIRAGATCDKLIALCRGSDAIARELQTKFQDAVADVEDIVIKILAPEDGAFRVSSGVLELAEEPIARLLSFVLHDVRRGKPGPLSPDEVHELLERVFVDYVLHELRHRTQGVEAYATIQKLKGAAGASAVAEFDVLADRDAAFAFASVHAESATRADFLASFREALFLSSAYFFRVFRPTPDRPDKVARAIGVLLMAARLAPLDLEDAVSEAPTLPLDAPLFATLSTGQNSLAIYRAEPSRSLLGVASDAEGHGVSDLVSDVRTGDFDSALQKSVGLVHRLGIP